MSASLITEQDVEWIRLLAGNHTISFREFQKWAPDFYQRLRTLVNAHALATPASAPAGERTDTERLDWLERMRADVYCVTANEFEHGKPPRLLRFSVQAENWKRGLTPEFESTDGSARTLRQSIDAARAAERRDQEEGR